MKPSRRAHTERARVARRRVTLAIVGGLAVVGVLAALALTLFGDTPDSVVPASASSGGSAGREAVPSPSATGDSSETAAAVEVPSLVGRTLAEARVLLEATGVALEIVEDATRPADAVGDARIVAAQEPPPGGMLPANGALTVVVPADSAATALSAPAGAVVVIDPGHQSQGDTSPEPIGPGSDQGKPRVTGGTTGVVTRVPEYEVVLQIATNLKTRLESAGVTVVMTRTTNDVDVSNAERAQIANDAKADLLVRVHADGAVDATRAGISTLYPAGNSWIEPISADSLRAARTIHEAVVASTGAISLGTVPRDDLTGFNWSSVPSVLVECGFMTNPVEDRLLSSPHYQDKLAQGMAEGIVGFLGE